jgi:hypothetical protein
MIHQLTFDDTVECPNCKLIITYHYMGKPEPCPELHISAIEQLIEVRDNLEKECIRSILAHVRRKKNVKRIYGNGRMKQK